MEHKSKECLHENRDLQYPKCLHCLDCGYNECVDKSTPEKKVEARTLNNEKVLGFKSKCCGADVEIGDYADGLEPFVCQKCNKICIAELIKEKKVEWEEFDKECPGYSGLGINGTAPIMVKREDAIKYILQEKARVVDSAIEKITEINFDALDEMRATKLLAKIFKILKSI